MQTVQQAEHEEKLRSIQDSKRHLYEQYALGEIDLETYRTRKAVYDTELVQAKNVHAVITAQTKQIKSDYEIKLKQQEIVQEVGNANMLYDYKPSDRLFTVSKFFIKRRLEKGAEAAGLPQIRVHDLRHPYVKPTTKKFITFFEVFRAAS